MFALLFLSGSLACQSYVVYLIADFNDTWTSIQDLRVQSIVISLSIELIIGILVVALYVKAAELLETIKELAGPSRIASLHFISSDDDRKSLLVVD